MSDAEIRSLERALATSPTRERLDQLDAARRRAGDGPWLPARVGDLWRWDADALIAMAAVFMRTRPGDAVPLSRIPSSTIAEWMRSISAQALRIPALLPYPSQGHGTLRWPFRARHYPLTSEDGGVDRETEAPGG